MDPYNVTIVREIVTRMTLESQGTNMPRQAAAKRSVKLFDRLEAKAGSIAAPYSVAESQAQVQQGLCKL